jgi:hypothetical protein
MSQIEKPQCEAGVGEGLTYEREWRYRRCTFAATYEDTFAPTEHSDPQPYHLCGLHHNTVRRYGYVRLAVPIKVAHRRALRRVR